VHSWECSLLTIRLKTMDDFFEFFVFCILLPALVVILFVSLFSIAADADNEEQKKDDKRYELCLKRDMQWVDGNCIGK
jgi:hypothetical protein